VDALEGGLAREEPQFTLTPPDRNGQVWLITGDQLPQRINLGSFDAVRVGFKAWLERVALDG